jgi:Holliday junction resolvasome RuvABC endonuclease subunit
MHLLSIDPSLRGLGLFSISPDSLEYSSLVLKTDSTLSLAQRCAQIVDFLEVNYASLARFVLLEDYFVSRRRISTSAKLAYLQASIVVGFCFAHRIPYCIIHPSWLRSAFRLSKGNKIIDQYPGLVAKVFPDRVPSSDEVDAFGLYEIFASRYNLYRFSSLDFGSVPDRLIVSSSILPKTL